MPRKKLDLTYLTPEQLQIFLECSKSPFAFSKFIMLIHAQRGKVPFDLYPFQKATLYEFLKNPYNVILKFRQAGVTELISMYCLWLAMFHPFKNIVIISIKDRVAKKVLRKIKFMYKNLPNFLKVSITNGRTTEDYGTAQEMEFSNGSMISSIPTTEDAGRGEAVSLLVIDEAAIVRWAERIWAAAWPTLSCAKGDTPILIKNPIINTQPEIVNLDSLCPKQKGIKDISHLGLRTLSHKGIWQNILFSQNKGNLETWYVQDEKGKVGGYTPAHQLYTTKGWRTVSQIIDRDLYVVSVDTKLDNLTDYPVTVPPNKEILLPIPNFPKFIISNLGKVYRKCHPALIEVKPRKNNDGYLRVFLTVKGLKRLGTDKNNAHKSKVFAKAVARLVYETFIGPIPKNLTIDHINGSRVDNYLTNLRLLTPSENVSRSTRHSMGASLSSIAGAKLPDLKLRGRILKLYRQGYTYKQIAEKIYPSKLQGTKFVKRIIQDRGSRVYISKLQVVKKTIEPIYDIHVENDHSYISADNFINHNTGGRAIINSTAYGIGNFFHSLFTTALSGGNPFNPIRLYWRMHPERGDDWYLSQRQILGPRKTAQEIDGDFLTSGNTVFDLADIREIEDLILDGEIIFDGAIAHSYKVLESQMEDQLKVFELPKPGVRYFIGSDIATGRSQDYTTFSVMDRFGDEKACFKGRIPIDKASDILAKTGKRFNQALLAPESNDIGLGVATNLQTQGYPNLYYSRTLLKKKGEHKPKQDLIPGWYTTKKNRPVIIANLEEDVRNENCHIKDQFFCTEAYTFIYDEQNRPVALNKSKVNPDNDIAEDNVFSDDAIFAKAITNHIRKEKINSVTILPG